MSGNLKRQKQGMVLEPGDYGAVLITGGKHQGMVGYYDDDDGNLAIVYLGAWSDGYIRKRHRSLRRLSSADGDVVAVLFPEKPPHPALVAQLGLPKPRGDGGGA